MSRPYLERLGAGACGGGVSFSPQQAEMPSAAAAKAIKAKYFTVFIGAV